MPVSDLVLKLGNDGTEVIAAELGTLDAEVGGMVSGLGVSDTAVPLQVGFLQSLHHNTGSVAVEFDCCHGWFPLVDFYRIQERGAVTTPRVPVQLLSHAWLIPQPGREVKRLSSREAVAFTAFRVLAGGLNRGDSMDLIS